MNEPGLTVSIDSHYDVRVEEVRYYPDVFDFLLCRFPHTMSLKLSSNLPAHLQDQIYAQIDAWIEFKGPDSEDTILMAPYRDRDDYLLEGTFSPAQPGNYRFRIILAFENEQYVVPEGEREIIAPRAQERWTHGPVAIRIDEGLFLGNAAAAANPLFLEERVRGKDLRPAIAIVNAAGERQTRPALLSANTPGKTQFVYRHFPFTDFSDNPLDKAELWNAVKWMHEQIGKGPVFVHCHAGIGRAGSLVVAYLRLFRHPEKTFDQIVETVKEVVRKEGHHIFPHVELPESLKDFQEDEQCRRALANLLGKESYEYEAEPAGEVKSIAFANGYEIGQTRTLRRGEEIVVQTAVAYEGVEPRGVYAHTNLNEDNQEIPMGRAGEDLYQTRVRATRVGEKFWLTASASTRQFDHPLKRRWIGGDTYFNVISE